MGLGIRGWRRVGLCLCKMGGVGSRSNSAPWILCSAVRTISCFAASFMGAFEHGIIRLNAYIKGWFSRLLY